MLPRRGLAEVRERAWRQKWFSGGLISISYRVYARGELSLQMTLNPLKCQAVETGVLAAGNGQVKAPLFERKSTKPGLAGSSIKEMRNHWRMSPRRA